METTDSLPSHEQDELVDLFTEEQLIERYGIKKEDVPLKEKAKAYLKKTFTCSRSKAKSTVQTVVPITKWLPNYKVKQWLLGDVTAGLTVGVVHLPQAMAYGLLASMPPVTGLYVSFFPVLAYVVFGTSRHISIGTFAVVSLMIASVLDENVPYTCGDSKADSATSPLPNATASPPSDCDDQYNQRKIEVAVSLSIAVAIITFIMYILRLGIVTVYLSSHMISGFTCGAAFHVLTSQVSKLVGINVPRKSGPLALIYTYIDLFSKITTINWATVIVSFCCILVLVIGKEINLRFKKKLPFPLPWEFAVVIFSDLASYFAYLNTNYDVSIVGVVPTGIVTSVPNPTDIGNVLPNAISITLVTYSVGISLARMFAVKHGYEIDPNQELLAYTVYNVFGSFFSCFPAATSLSRTVIWEETGGNTQATGIVSSALILIILLWIGPLFQFLPQAALASIIVVNLKRLLRQFDRLPTLFKISKLDCSVWVITWLAVFLLGVDTGLYIGIAYSILTAVIRTQISRVHTGRIASFLNTQVKLAGNRALRHLCVGVILQVKGEVVIPISDERVYRNSKKFSGESKEADPSILVFRFPTPLYFATKQRFQKQLAQTLGFEPAMEAMRSRKERQKENQYVAARSDSTQGTSSVTTIATSNGAHNDAAKETRSLRYLILDMEISSYIDNDGMNCIKTLSGELSELNITLLLAHCGENVRQCLLAGGFPPTEENSPPPPTFFINVAKAVLYANRCTTPSPRPSVLQDEDFTSETSRL